MIAETLRQDLAAARLEREVAQREVAELRESIARDIEAEPRPEGCCSCSMSQRSGAMFALRASRIARGLA